MIALPSYSLPRLSTASVAWHPSYYCLFDHIFLIPFVGLAIYDNLCLTSTILHDGLHYWFASSVIAMDPDDWQYGNAVYWPVTWPIYKFSFNGNASMTVLICLERFIFIVYPLKSKIWCSKKRTLLYICIATAMSFILAIPHFFAFTWNEGGEVKPNRDFWLLFVPIDILEDLLFRSILPVVTLITLSTIAAIKVNCMIVKYCRFWIFPLCVNRVFKHLEKKSIFVFFQLKKFSLMVKEMTGVENSSRERKLTWMMFCVVILFIFSNISLLNVIFLSTNCISDKTFAILRPISVFLYVVNSSANLFIYLYFNKKFRDTFISIFSCTKKNQNVLNTTRPLIMSPIIENINALKTPPNNKDAIKKTAVFHQNVTEDRLSLTSF